MAVIDKSLNVAGQDKQIVQFWSTNTELQLLFIHFIIRNIDDDIKITFTQGNVNNDIDRDTNLIVGDDLLAPLDDCEDTPIEHTFTASGNYVIALDTFYGKWGNAILNKLSATTGTVRIISNTIKKV